MIEYIVVLAFSVILLSQASSGQDAPIKQLADAIRNYHRHYTYAMAIAYIPECDYSTSLSSLGAMVADDFTTNVGIADTFLKKLGDSITISGDRCIDWQNPSLPTPDISFENFIDMPTADQIGKYIGDIVTDMVEDALDDFINPGNLFKNALKFNIKDFF